MKLRYFFVKDAQAGLYKKKTIGKRKYGRTVTQNPEIWDGLFTHFGYLFTKVKILGWPDWDLKDIFNKY